MPRKWVGDRFSENRDGIYPELEKAEQALPSHLLSLKMDADEDRVARSIEDMETEAKWLKSLFEER